MRKSLLFLVSLFLVLQISPAIAATVTAAGGETICNQTVGDATNVSAYRLVSGFCVVEFKNVGSTTWTVPNGVTSITYLVVAGGGGGAGGQASEHGGGGGGAGGLLAGTLSVSAGSVNITVGGGGAGGAANSPGVSGSNSSLAGSVTSTGGGGGGTYFNYGASTGGSGGGAGVSATAAYLTGANGTGGQGNKGGNVTVSGTSGRHGGGGGGAGSAGGNTTTSGSLTITAGAGGDGATSSITGSTISYAGGGGGGGSSQGVGASGGAAGGTGGGGTGATYNGVSLVSAATNGTSNTGGGGGGGIGTGGGNASAGGSGGSGTIIVRYALAPAISIAPSISGSATFGQILSTTDGTWSFTPVSYTYQWSKSGTPSGTYTNISGATNSTYTLLAADIDQYLKVTVTATNTGGSSAATSSATSIIMRSTPSASISIQAGALIYRQAKVITAITSVAGKITFKANGKNVPGCISKSVSALNSFTATCSYRPSIRGSIIITTVLIPVDPNYLSSTNSLDKLLVFNRSGAR